MLIGENAAEIEEVFAAYTLSKVTELHKADYIFILQDAEAQLISEAFLQAKKGTLRDPQQSATIIMETEKLSNDPDLMLEGPGIETAENVQIAASELWMIDKSGGKSGISAWRGYDFA